MKIKEVIENFKKISPEETVIEQKGAWVYVNGKAYRAKQLQEIYEEYAKNDTGDDIRKLVSAIRQDGKHIFMSTDIRKMQEAGKRISKMAKRIINILGE